MKVNITSFFWHLSLYFVFFGGRFNIITHISSKRVWKKATQTYLLLTSPPVLLGFCTDIIQDLAVAKAAVQVVNALWARCLRKTEVDTTVLPFSLTSRSEMCPPPEIRDCDAPNWSNWMNNNVTIGQNSLCSLWKSSRNWCAVTWCHINGLYYTRALIINDSTDSCAEQKQKVLWCQRKCICCLPLVLHNILLLPPWLTADFLFQNDSCHVCIEIADYTAMICANAKIFFF